MAKATTFESKFGITPARELEPIKQISTGNPAFDYVTGGGLILGAITTIIGPTSVGKTATALELAVPIINAGGKAAYVDAENRITPDRVSRAGVDLDKLLFPKQAAVSCDDCLEFLLAAVENGYQDSLVIIDSLQTLKPLNSFNKLAANPKDGLNMADRMDTARFWSDAQANLNSIIRPNNLALIFIGQDHTKLNMYEVGPQTPGSKKIGYMSSMIIKLSGGSKAKEGTDTIVGTTLNYEISKNTHGPLYLKAESRIVEAGIDHRFALVKLMLKTGVCVKKGNTVEVEERFLSQVGLTVPKLGGSENQAVKFLYQHPEVYQALYDVWLAELTKPKYLTVVDLDLVEKFNAKFDLREEITEKEELDRDNLDRIGQ